MEGEGERERLYLVCRVTSRRKQLFGRFLSEWNTLQARSIQGARDQSWASSASLTLRILDVKQCVWVADYQLENSGAEDRRFNSKNQLWEGEAISFLANQTCRSISLFLDEFWLAQWHFFHLFLAVKRERERKKRMSIAEISQCVNSLGDRVMVMMIDLSFCSSDWSTSAWSVTIYAWLLFPSLPPFRCSWTVSLASPSWGIMKSLLDPPARSFLNLIDYLTTIITHGGSFSCSFSSPFSLVFDEHLCFSIWSYICSSKHSREKNDPFSSLSLSSPSPSSSLSEHFLR